jgi:hypothetical protein
MLPKIYVYLSFNDYLCAKFRQQKLSVLNLPKFAQRNTLQFRELHQDTFEVTPPAVQATGEVMSHARNSRKS